MYSENEQVMWESGTALDSPVELSDDAINEKYVRGEDRVVVETNREKLPLFVDSLRKHQYINVHPIYQRRSHRWDVKRQSRLIESFIINVPVPPIFLYERDFNSFEVMDGQQRIQAIRRFYNNEFSLRGLQRWPELNGRSYAALPSKVRAGIDRRSISSIVLLRESSLGDEDAMLLRQLVFERLNTGGVRLERQEIRNAIDAGAFNNLLIELSRRPAFRKVWQMPAYSDEEEVIIPRALINNAFYGKMEDAETVLRFFALRHASRYARGMQGFLDLYMIKALRFTAEDIDFLRDLFDQTIDLVVSVYGDLACRPYDTRREKWMPRPHVAFWDAVMVSFSNHLNDSARLIERSDAIIEMTKSLFYGTEQGAFTGRANTKTDVEARLYRFDTMILDAIS